MPGAAFYALCLLACILLSLSPRDFMVIDQGDYPRTVSRIVEEPVKSAPIESIRQVGEDWRLVERGSMRPNLSSGTSSLVFFAMAFVQDLFGLSYSFNFVYSIVSCLLIGFSFILSFQIASRLNSSRLVVGLGAIGLSAAFFLPYTGAFLRSFYAEFAFIVFFPVLLISFFAGHGVAGLIVRFLAVTACATAKTQLFYLPLMYALLCTSWFRSPNLHAQGSMRLWLLMLMSQLIALGPIASSDYTAANAHHSTYFGSYLVMSPDELDALGVSASERACIGVDAWGNRIRHSNDSLPQAGIPCGAAEAKGFLGMIEPYIRYPLLLLRVWISSPVHMTVNYFHVHEDNLYVRQVASSPPTTLLLAITRGREALPYAALFIGVVVALCSVSFISRDSALRRLFLFLAIFPVSQVVISLVGEGVRDLSKHLMLANYSIDIGIVAVLLVLCSVAFPSARSAPDG